VQICRLYKELGWSCTLRAEMSFFVEQDQLRRLNLNYPGPETVPNAR